MPTAKRSITINRPVDEVFAYVADGANAPAWRSSVLEISRQKGEGKGSVWRQRVKGPFRRRVAADYQVTAFERGKRLAFKAIAGPVRPTGEYTFRETGESTTVTFALDAKLSGLRRLLLGRSVQRSMDGEMRALDKLKSVLESGEAAKPAAVKAAPPAKATAKAKPTATKPTPKTAAKPVAKSAAKPSPTRARPAAAPKTNPKPTSRRSPRPK